MASLFVVRWTKRNAPHTNLLNVRRNIAYIERSTLIKFVSRVSLSTLCVSSCAPRISEWSVSMFSVDTKNVGKRTPWLLSTENAIRIEWWLHFSASPIKFTFDVNFASNILPSNNSTGNKINELHSINLVNSPTQIKSYTRILIFNEIGRKEEFRHFSKHLMFIVIRIPLSMPRILVLRIKSNQLWIPKLRVWHNFATLLMLNIVLN